MFNKLEERIAREVSGLKEAINNSSKEFKDEFLVVLKKRESSIGDISLAFEKLKVEVDQKLIKQHQEYSDKLFEILASFLRWNKEISLVSYLGGKEPDLKKLKLELMRPQMEENWAKANAEEADRINKALESKGEKVRRAWEKYKDEKLALGREKRDTSMVDAKLEILNILTEGVE